jgi:hypothetical protein
LASKPPRGRKPPSKEPGKPDQERPRHRPEGREHEVHKEILERRMRGGAEPTPDAYRDALEQWKKLPGSKVSPPTDVGPPADEHQPEPTDRGTSKPGTKE